MNPLPPAVFSLMTSSWLMMRNVICTIIPEPQASVVTIVTTEPHGHFSDHVLVGLHLSVFFVNTPSLSYCILRSNGPYKHVLHTLLCANDQCKCSLALFHNTRRMVRLYIFTKQLFIQEIWQNSCHYFDSVFLLVLVICSRPCSLFNPLL